MLPAMGVAVRHKAAAAVLCRDFPAMAGLTAKAFGWVAHASRASSAAASCGRSLKSVAELAATTRQGPTLVAWGNSQASS